MRARHAHAWSRAYVGGRWIDVDLTPPAWLEAEAELAPPWERALDLARWAAFRWATRPDEDASPLWWFAAALLSAVLAWRIVKQRRTVRLQDKAAAATRRLRGGDSEFYRLERALGARYRPREPHEALAAWLRELRSSLSPDQAEKISFLSDLHHRHRFDPVGLAPAERAALREGVAAFPIS